ARP
ncbi:hypothetical protein ECTW00353_0333, partial [Escherichia coli TW00353]